MSASDENGRIAALERICAELRAQLADARMTVAPTMKKQLRCPACGCMRIAHVNHIPDQGLYSGGMLTLGRVVRTLENGEIENKTVGSLEAFACTACGLVELYAAVPAALRDLEGSIRILDGSPPDTGPYR
jgi:hypothetical protein